MQTDWMGVWECCDTCTGAWCRRNRVISGHGLRLPLELFRTAAKGWGVRCAAAVPVGAFVATYEGELITNEEAVSAGCIAELRHINGTLFGLRVWPWAAPHTACLCPPHATCLCPAPCLQRAQEDRGAADSYLFDLHHFINVHCDPSTKPADRSALPPLPGGVRGGNAAPPRADAELPEHLDQHLVIDAHSIGASRGALSGS